MNKTLISVGVVNIMMPGGHSLLREWIAKMQSLRLCLYLCLHLSLSVTLRTTGDVENQKDDEKDEDEDGLWRGKTPGVGVKTRRRRPIT